MKQNNYKSKKYNKGLFIFSIIVTQPVMSVAQAHQDCMDAITVCTNTYIQTAASAGFGNLQEVSSGTTCLANGETNSTWYVFSIQNPGTLMFQINPLNVQDDYDYILYKYSGNCSDIINGTTPPLRCNYSSATGSTGLTQGFSGINISSNGVNQCAPITVLQNEKYMLMVNNFTATNSGYALNFSGTATIFDAAPPVLTSTNITSCGPSLAYIYFSESIKVSSIAPDGSDFKITGPSPVSISSATPLSSNYTVLTPAIKIYFTSPIVLPGNYIIHIKKGSDGNTISDFCDNMTPVNAQINFDILYSSPIAVISSATNVICNNNNGTATATVSGGAAPYNYNWNSTPPQQSLAATNLAPGLYTFVVTDANGCTSHANAVITVTGIPTLTSSAVPETCDSMNNGSASVFVNGGISPYTYLWNTNPVQNSATATGLTAGSYIVIVTGANGCTASATIIVPLIGQPVINMHHANVSCVTSASGSAMATVNGHAPFSYLWSNGQTGTSISGLTQGSYILTVSDLSGCTSSAAVVITKGGMQLSVSTVNLVCGNVHNGTATVIAGQAIPPLTYLWNTQPAQTVATATNLAEGNYIVTVIDSSGCKDSISANVTGPFPLIANVTTISAGCTFSDGSATLNISGGNAPYIYTWNTLPVQHTAVATNLFAGAYQAEITDSSNCIVSSTAYISNWNGPQGFISNVIDASCNKQNGSASVTNITGNSPFNFLWYTNPVQHNAISTGLGAGTYTVKITDHEGCLSFLNVKINATGVPDLILNHIVNASCGQTDGIAEVTATGGTAPFTFEWLTNPLQFGSTASGLGAGIYLTIVTDATGCKDSLYINVPQNKAHNDFTYSISCLNEPANFGGTTDVSNIPLQWTWNFGDTASMQDNVIQDKNASHIFSSSGTYIVTLYIYGSCATDTLTKSLNESVKPHAAFTFTDKPLATAPVNFTYTGTPVDNLRWDFGEEIISYEPDPVHIFKTRGLYPVVLYITDELGCKDTSSQIIDIDDAPAVFVPNGFTPNNDGINDNFIIPSHGMKTCDIKIFDRWGAMIFHSADPVSMNNQGWNGNVNGSKGAEGTYAYILNGKLENGIPIVKNGFINLIR